MYVLFCLCVIRCGFRRNLARAVEEVITQTPCRPGRVSLTVSPCSSFPPSVLNYRMRLHLRSGDCAAVTVGVSSDMSAQHLWLLQIPLFRGRLRNWEHGPDVDFGISLINSQSCCTYLWECEIRGLMDNWGTFVILRSWERGCYTDEKIYCIICYYVILIYMMQSLCNICIYYQYYIIYYCIYLNAYILNNKSY